MENTIEKINTNTEVTEVKEKDYIVIYSYKLFEHLIYDLGLLHMFMNTSKNKRHPSETIYFFKRCDEIDKAVTLYTDAIKARREFIKNA